MHLCGSRYVDRAEDVTEIKVYSNLPEVSLYKDGQLVETRKGDKVFTFQLPITGKHSIEASVDKKDGRVLVEGVNMLTKHTKPSMANQNGGIVHQEGYIDASNVMLLHNGKATRVGFKMDGDKKVRFAKATGEVID